MANHFRPPIFHVRNVSKHFGRIAALSEVAFEVRAGEVLGLIGPNGAGKTTLFECLAGVLPVDGGAIYVDGRPLTTEHRGRRSRCDGRLSTSLDSSVGLRNNAPLSSTSSD
jgi:ABC-type branched-subunit amino acid transport system ATPase component